MMVDETMGLTLSEASHQLRVSDNTLREWLRKNKGPQYIRIGRKYLFSRESIAAFLRGQSCNNPPTGTASA